MTPRDLIVGFATPDAEAAAGDHVPADVAKAWAQHLAVLEVNAELASRGMDVAEAARLLGVGNVRTLGQKLAGRDPITLDDLVLWTLVIGGGPLRAWASIASEPFPANYWPSPASWLQGQWRRPASGETFEGPAWRRLASELEHHAATERLEGRGHLLDDAQLAGRARAALMALGMPAVALQLRRAPGRNVFDVEGVATVAVLLGRDPESAAARADLRRRAAESVSVLAETDQGVRLLIAILEPTAEQILAAMFETPAVDAHAIVPWARVAEHLAAGSVPTTDFFFQWEMRQPGQAAVSASIWHVEKEAQSFPS